MTSEDVDIEYESLDYSGALARLAALKGRDVLVELRVRDLHGPFRLAARGVLVGQRGPAERRHGDPLDAFMLDTGGFLAVREEDFVGAEWHAGSDEGQPSAQPRLNIAFTDSVLHIAVLWRNDPA